VAVVEMKADFKKQCNHLARNSGDPTQLKTMGERERERETHTHRAWMLCGDGMRWKC
jgi:hypothetical protein